MSKDTPPRRRRNDETSKTSDPTQHDTVNDLPLLMRDFELAVHNFHKTGSKLAEKDLKSFRESRKPIIGFLYIIEHSKRPEVHLEAVMALQEALMREWHALGDEQLLALRRILFEWPLQHVFESNVALRKAMYHLAVIMVKRAWLAPSLEETPAVREGREHVMSQIAQLLRHNDGTVVREGVRVLRALVEVLSQDRVAFLDVPLSYHLRVRTMFEARYLPALTTLCVPLLRMSMEAAERDERAKDLAEELISVISEVLMWPFVESVRDKERNDDGGADDSDDEEEDDMDFGTRDTPLQPGEPWRGVLVDNSELWEVLLAIHTSQRADPNLSTLAAQSLMALATLSGTVFATPAQRDAYVQRILRGALALMHASVARGPQHASANEVRDVAMLLVSVMRTYPYDTLLSAATSLPDGNFFDVLVSYSEHVMGLARQGVLTGSLSGLDEDGAEVAWDDGDVDVAMGAVEELLEVWLLLITAAPEAPQWAQFCGRVYGAYVQTRLALAQAELDQREGRLDEAKMEEDEDKEISLLQKKDRLEHRKELTSAAHIARFAVGPSAATLVPRLHEARARLAALFSQPPNSKDMTSVLEECHWLTLLAGHFLADDTEREHASDVHVPLALQQASLHSASPAEDPVLALSTAVFALVELENAAIEAQRMDEWSPLLAESLVWFLQRWTLTYLARVDGDGTQLAPHLRDAYATTQQREAVLDFLLRKVARNLLAWNAEPDVTEESCRLFLALARLRLTAGHLRNLPAWLTLFNAHTQRAPELTMLSGKAQRHLVQGFVALALGDGEAERAAYIEQVAAPVARALMERVQAPDFAKVAHDGTVMIEIWNDLDRLRGVLRGVKPDSARAVWAWVAPLLPALVGLYRGYARDHASVVSILQAWVDVCKFLLELLPTAEQHALFEATGQLITAFQQCGHAQGVKRKANSPSDQAADLAQYQRFVKLYKIFASIAPYPTQPKSAQMTWFGLAVVVPALNIEPGLLQYPKLGQLHFSVLHDAVQHHAHALAQLPDFLFKGVLQTLLDVLRVDSELPEGELERLALNTTALFIMPHLVTRLRDRRDLYASAPQQELLDVFTERVLSFILRSPSTTRADVRLAAADAYLACLCFKPQRYQAWIAELAARQASPLKGQLETHFDVLHQSLQGDPTFERAQRTRFAEAFDKFLSPARGLISWPK